MGLCMVNADTYRFWKAKLPIDEVLVRIHIAVVSRCTCCSNPLQETVDHLFLTREFATKIWQYFINGVGLQGPFVQCNIDGVSKGNPGPSSASLYIRNEEGDLIYASGRQFPNTTNIIAEATAIKDGLQYCISNQLLPVKLETDSLTMKNILKGRWEVPWSISMEVNGIQRIRRDKAIQFEHMLREGNTATDFCTNLAFHFAGSFHFTTFQEATVKARRILNLDKASVPHI
ncbi:uncharacterized protein LOC132631010 [Lycium barbarum]|uniref:uncharacterized protein LOC132631010 n=1 Tax=Lycium barbarum TaxID=112863 RepID=UPI00293F1270|nr:uncharacterized protein LOC132631010 [Lycium barbarum]